MTWHRTVALGDLAEVRIYPQEPNTSDASDMYVLDVLGVTVIVRRRARGDTYVHVDDDGMGAFLSPLVYEIRNDGECATGDPGPAGEVCDECGRTIPDSERGMVSAHHAESCSLHPANVA